MDFYLPERTSIRSIGRPPGQHLANAKKLFTYIKTHGQVVETTPQIAAATALSTDQIERCLKTLRERGCVHVSKSYRSYVLEGRRLVNTARTISLVED